MPFPGSNHASNPDCLPIFRHVGGCADHVQVAVRLSRLLSAPPVVFVGKAPIIRAEESMPKTDSGHVAGEKHGRPVGSMEYQRRKTLLKTGALQDAIFNSANFSSI